MKKFETDGEIKSAGLTFDVEPGGFADGIIFDEPGRVDECMWNSLVDRDPRNHHGKYVVPPETTPLLYLKTESRAVIHMGGTDAYLQKRVNWFHRWTIRLVFGWKVRNL